MEEKAKHNPGSKGVTAMNTHTPAELKELRKEIIEEARAMIGMGWTYITKVKALSTRFGVSERQAKKYIAWTRDDIQKRKQESYEREYDEVLIKLEWLYTQNVTQCKLKDAADILKQLITLRGYEAPKKLMIASQIEVKTDLSHLKPEELLMIQALLSKSNGMEEDKAFQSLMKAAGK